MRNLASIQRISSIKPIPNADKIECATILGWEVVIRKDEFKVNDLVVYVEIDSILPERPWTEFLKSKRIKTVRLRGQLSQGIIFSRGILEEKYFQLCESLGTEQIEGTDVTELLGITKYEPAIHAQLAGNAKGNFPSFLHKTDETRIQSVPGVLQRHADKLFYVTEKVDGSSCTVYSRRSKDVDGIEFGVCSRNLDLKESEDNSFWKVVKQLNLKEKLEKYPTSIAIQGELLGPGIQGNKYQLKELTLLIFNVFDIDKQEYFSFDEFYKFIADNNLKCAPLVWSAYKLPSEVSELLNFSNAPSVLNNKIPREGIVIRPMEEARDEKLGRLSFKVINNEFLLKYSE